MDTSNPHHSPITEIPGGLWVTTDPEVHGSQPTLWDSEPNSGRGSFRADEVEESALCCSLSVSEDGLSEYSESQSHYGSDSGSRKSGRGSSAGTSPLTTVSDRSSSYPGNRSLPSPAYVSSGVASSVVASCSTPSVSGSESSAFSGNQAKEAAISDVLENGGVSPKRRGQLRGGQRRPYASGAAGPSAGGRGETLKGGWLGRPGPPPRGQVGFQSCLRPGLGSVRTILEEDEEGLDDDTDEEVMPPEKDAPEESHGKQVQRIPTAKTDEGGDSGNQAKGHFFVRSTSDQSKGGVNEGLLLPSRNRGNSEKRPAAHDRPGCLCPVVNTPTECSSIADSPPGSPREERLTMSVYFCGLPGTGYGRRRRSCGLCGRQVGRRAPQCQLCRLIVYCDRKCMDQHQASHFRSCPGASARRLREAAAALKIAETGEADDQEDNEPLKRAPNHGHHEKSTEVEPEEPLRRQSSSSRAKAAAHERSPLQDPGGAVESPVASSPARILVTTA